MNAVHFQGILGIGLAVGLGLLFQSQGQPLGGPLTTLCLDRLCRSGCCSPRCTSR